jgi:hypothetical protein
VSTVLLPRAAAPVFGEGPFYAAHLAAQDAPDETNIVWLAKPVLPDGSPLHWAVTVPSAHVDLDEVTVAELLFCSPLDPGGVPTVADILGAIDRQLARCRCDIGMCEARVAQEAGDHRDMAADRMTWCRARAAQIRGEVAA